MIDAMEITRSITLFAGGHDDVNESTFQIIIYFHKNYHEKLSGGSSFYDKSCEANEMYVNDWTIVQISPEL